MRRPGASRRRTPGFAEAQATVAAAPVPRVLADTCAIIVFYFGGTRGMSRRGIAAMGDGVLVSPVSVWELTRKTNDGKLPPPKLADAKNWLDFLNNRGFGLAPLTWEVAARANELPSHHRDPWDRLLIATALIEGIPIVTNDRAFAAYGVPTIW
jgi:PIN domain nuclease of toxin-antitoxin system